MVVEMLNCYPDEGVGGKDYIYIGKYRLFRWYGGFSLIPRSVGDKPDLLGELRRNM